jgi:RNA polymerase sigma-70 factor (ECF subfamily)
MAGTTTAMEPRELQDLVRSAQNGDLRAYGRLVESTQAMVYAVRRVLRDREAARDAAQETYLRVFRRIGDLRDPLAFPGWLRRVAVTTARSLARARRRYFLEPETTADVPVLNEQEAAWTGPQHAALAGAILNLSTDDRALCDRYYTAAGRPHASPKPTASPRPPSASDSSACANGCERRSRCRNNTTSRAIHFPPTCRRASPSCLPGRGSLPCRKTLSAVRGKR